MSPFKNALLRSMLPLFSVLALNVLAGKSYAAVPSTCTAVTITPSDGSTFYVGYGQTLSITVMGTASVSVTGQPNEPFQCNWNMYTKCNPTPGTIGKDTSNGFVNEVCDGMGTWKEPASFMGSPSLGVGSYVADTFATINVGNAKTSAQMENSFEILEKSPQLPIGTGVLTSVKPGRASRQTCHSHPHGKSLRRS